MVEGGQQEEGWPSEWDRRPRGTAVRPYGKAQSTTLSRPAPVIGPDEACASREARLERAAARQDVSFSRAVFRCARTRRPSLASSPATGLLCGVTSSAAPLPLPFGRLEDLLELVRIAVASLATDLVKDGHSGDRGRVRLPGRLNPAGEEVARCVVGLIEL